MIEGAFQQSDTCLYAGLRCLDKNGCLYPPGDNDQLILSNLFQKFVQFHSSLSMGQIGF